MDLEDARRILELEARVEELETKQALLAVHTEIDYEETLESLQDQDEQERESEKEEVQIK